MNLDPLNPVEIKEAERARERKRRQYLVGLVAPNGQVSEHFPIPPEEGGILEGDVPLIWANDEVQVTKRYKDKGYVLLEELCRLDGCPELYQKWRKAVLTRMDGIALRGDPGVLYPPTVRKRRRAAASTGRGDGVVFDLAKGDLVQDAEHEKRRLASRLEGLGIGNPLDDSKPEASSATSDDTAAETKVDDTAAETKVDAPQKGRKK